MASKSTSMERVRNIGIMAHIDAGKTTVTERLLYVTGRAYKMGEVHEGEATMDWMVQERERGITITSAVTTFSWADHEVHLIDTPGHVDFTIEVSRSLRVLDGAIAVFDAVAGVEPQTETVWRQADTYGVPRLGFVNKMDRIGADFGRCLEMMEQRFGDHCVAVQLPIGAEAEFSGVVDLVEMVAIEWPDPSDPRVVIQGAIPESMMEEAEFRREALLERIALEDEDFAVQYLENSASLTNDQIHEAIRRTTLAGALVPVMAGSALRNKGIQPLLHGIVRWLPSPTEVPPVRGIDPRNGEPVERAHDSKAPLAALAYKIAIMEDGRRMVFVRLYSGTMSTGQALYNPALDITEKPSRIFLMHANNRERMERIGAGNIFGVLGLKKTRTGDTVCAPDDPILLESIDSYEPVISQSVEPDTLREKEKLDISLAKLADEDPTFHWFEDPGTGQTIIRGMGELHLDILVDRLKREFGVVVRVGRPQVVYRETITATARVSETFERWGVEGENIFGSVQLSVAPRSRGDGNRTRWQWPGAQDADVPSWFGPETTRAVEEGIDQALQSGALEGYPVMDVEVTVDGVDYRDNADSVVGLTIAASSALRAALKEAESVRLSPVATVEVSTPPDFTGDVINTLNQRRGRIEQMEEISPMLSVIRATAPMEAMFGYSTELRSATQGRASFSMTFSHFDRL